MFISSLPQPTEWLKTFWQYCKDANAPGLVENLALVLFLVAIIWSGIKIATLGTGTQDYMGFFLRVMTAGYLVLAAAPLSQLTRDAWTDASNWGYATFAEPAVKRAQTEMKNIGQTAGYVATAAVVTAGVVSGVGALTSGAGLISAAGSAVGGVARASTSVAQTTNWIVWMAIPIVLVYYVIILGTGFSILIGSIILPLAGALMMFPSTLGAEWMGKWLKAIVAAIFSAAFVPLVFATAIEVGFIGPAKEYNASLEKNAKEWSSANSVDIDWGDVTQVGANLGKQIQKLEAQFSVALNYIGSFITSIFMLIIGVVAGVMVINTLSGQISSYVGGSLSAAGSGGVAGAGIAIARGLGALSGGSRGSATGSPKGPGTGSVTPTSPKGPGSAETPKGTYNGSTGKYTGSDRAAYDKASSEARSQAGYKGGDYGKGSTKDPDARASVGGANASNPANKNETNVGAAPTPGGQAPSGVQNPSGSSGGQNSGGFGSFTAPKIK
jgi:hypothetical protein